MVISLGGGRDGTTSRPCDKGRPGQVPRHGDGRPTDLRTRWAEAVVRSVVLCRMAPLHLVDIENWGQGRAQASPTLTRRFPSPMSMAGQPPRRVLAQIGKRN